MLMYIRSIQRLYREYLVFILPWKMSRQGVSSFYITLENVQVGSIQYLYYPGKYPGKEYQVFMLPWKMSRQGVSSVCITLENVQVGSVQCFYYPRKCHRQGWEYQVFILPWKMSRFGNGLDQQGSSFVCNFSNKSCFQAVLYEDT